jgi:RHS repeat-associated protein
VFVAQTPENFIYDLDGNQTKDGRFNYTWDGENRLIAMTSLTNAPVASQYSNVFTYDYMGRRIQKVVSTNSGSAWVVSYTNKFIYDGWNVAAILDGTNKLLYTFAWGTDLSGTMQGAGGVGGLLSMTVCTGSNAGTYFCCYDGNGNVVALVNAANGSVACNLEYGPFGEVIRATGPMAKLNPFMFSTKFYDWETGLYYYGYRYYNPSTGRWLSRDPAQEAGCVNLYAFVFNTPLNAIDYLGLDDPGHTGSIEMFLSFWSGDTGGAGLSQNLTDEVMKNQTIVDFSDSIFKRAARSMKCASNGSVVDRMKLDDFNPNWTWILSGNWQLSMSGRADWNCGNASDWSGGQGAKGCNCCKCNIKMQLVGSISKLYTFFHHPGGNPANIITELPAIIGEGLGGAEEYTVFQKLSQTENWPAAHCDK